MRLSKKQQRLWVIIVAIAAVGLLLTSMLPILYSLLR